jgi:hypothetical protein
MTKVWTIYKFASKLTWMGIIERRFLRNRRVTTPPLEMLEFD